MEDNAMNRKQAREQMLSEILSNYVPANGEPDYEPTTKEFVRDLEETIEISPEELSAELIHQGFHLKRVGAVFRWQIDIL